MEYRFPKSISYSARNDLVKVLPVIHSIIDGDLIGVYLCGSLAMGCYNPRSSDIDIIVVARQELTEQLGKRVLECLKEVCSKGARVELSVVSEDVVRNPQYPMKVDLHFEYWGNNFVKRLDKEILSNLYTTKERGFCVWGAPIDDMFSEISAEHHLKSVIEDILHTRKYLHEGPGLKGYDVTVYWILGSCRILGFARERKVFSKLEGGYWGIANLPRRYHRLIRQALSSYNGKQKIKGEWNYEELESFVDYMSRTILKVSKRTS